MAMLGNRRVAHLDIRGLKRIEYDRLVELGVFRDERVELMYGAVVQMSPIGVPHNTAVAELTRIFVLGLEGHARVHVQSSFAASDDSEPEPDFVITNVGTNWREHPSLAHLIVEVAESSLRYDRREKAALYAETAVGEYWIVDLVHGEIVVHRDAADGAWRSVTTYGRGEAVAPAKFPHLVVAVSAVVPPLDANQ